MDRRGACAKSTEPHSNDTPERRLRMAPWARGLGVTLVRTERATVEADPALRRALLDAVEHAYDGPLPAVPEHAEWYVVRAGGTTVGALAFVRDAPRTGEVALHALAIAEAHHGRALGTKALLAAERRLLRDGALRLVTRVPRTNGRGLYFMLRAGFTPLAPSDVPRASGDATWFGRRHRAEG